MEAAGIIRRQVFDQAPLRVEYSVTEAGASLNEAVHMLAEWGLKHVVAPRQLMADAAQ
jgi:DNA-binding HxlR family transcriptional regulator